MYNFFIRYRYCALGLFIYTLLLCHLKNGAFHGDYWEHAAVINELCAAPLTPQDPITGTAHPHKGFVPYHFAWGLIGAALRLDAISIMALMAVVNLALLLLILPWWTKKFFGNTETAFWALIFIVFLWPERPWIFSAFFHLRALPHVLAYPATFSMIGTLAALGLYQQLLTATTRYRYAHILSIVLLAATVTLTHPLTATLMWIGLGAVFLSAAKKDWKRQALTLIGMGLSVVVLLWLWPLYPFFGLATTDQKTFKDFHGGSLTFYDDAFKNLFPTFVIGVPALLIAARRNIVHPIVIMTAGLVALYGLSYLSQKYFFARVISFIAMMLQIQAGHWVATLEHRRLRGCATLSPPVDPRAATQVFARAFVPLAYAMIIGVTLLCCGLQIVPSSVKDFVFHHKSTYEDLLFLRRFVGHNEKILTDQRTAFSIPALTGKVLAHPLTLIYVPDHDQRRAAVDRFFSATASLADRQTILTQYKPDFILLNRNHLRGATSTQVAALSESFKDHATLVHHDAIYHLWKIEEKLDEKLGAPKKAPSAESRVQTGLLKPFVADIN